MAHECEQVENIREIKNNVQKLFNMSLPPWVRTVLIAVIAALFGLYGTIWVYASQTYATKQEVKEIKEDTNGLLKEILSEVKRK